MQPTTSRKTILLGLAVIAALTVFFVVSVKKGTLEERNRLATTPIAGPLFLEENLAQLTPEQQKTVALYKKHLLLRVASGVSLSKEEKAALFASTRSSSEKIVLGPLTLIDQSVFHFNVEELKLISEAILKK